MFVEKSLRIEALQGNGSDALVTVLPYEMTRTAVSPEISDEQVSEEHVTNPDEAPDEAPDGGLRAWLVVFAAALVMFSTLGFILSWGIFQAYYEENLLLHDSPSAIAWIGSTQYALACLLSLPAGRMFDLGHFRIPFFAASCVFVACTFLIAECTQFWQLFLTQGIGLGVACGIMWTPVVIVISHWFSERHNLALSISGVGSALGTIAFPVAAQNLIPSIGFRWAVRVFGFILMATLGVANILIKRRLPPVDIRGGLFNLKEFRNKAFTVYCISGFIILLGLDTELTYLSVSAVAIGVSKDFSLYILAIANAASALRVLSGLMADKIGAINTMAISTTITGIVTIAWPFAKNESQLIAIAAIYGFSLGAYVSLYPTPLEEMGDKGDAGRRVGMFMSFMALGGIAGPPISGAISTATRGFIAAGYYSGGSIIFGVALLLVAKYLHLGRLRGKF